MEGPNTATDWAIEGRRLVPLLPRLVPHTAFTALADQVANIAAVEKAKFPPDVKASTSAGVWDDSRQSTLQSLFLRSHFFVFSSVLDQRFNSRCATA